MCQKRCIFPPHEKHIFHYTATAKALAPVATIGVPRSVVADAVRFYPKNKEFYDEWCELMNDPSHRMPEFTEFQGEPFKVYQSETMSEPMT